MFKKLLTSYVTPLVTLALLTIFFVSYEQVFAAEHSLTESMGDTITMKSFDPPLAPGDTVIIDKNRTSGIYLYEIYGSSSSWITFKNPSNSSVIITGKTKSAPSNLRMYGCRYVRILGNNYNSEEYGIKLFAGGNGAGLSFKNSRDFEIAYVEISNTGGVGIGGGTSFQSPWTGSEIMEDVSVHHNFIHDIGTEGIYLGHSEIGDFPKFKDIQIYSNKIKNCGWDGLQLGQTVGTNNNIYDNDIEHIGTARENGQWFGLILNPEHKGVNIFENRIKDTWHNAIEIHVQANGPVNIYANTITDAGQNGTANGIKVSSSIGSSKIFNNTVISSGGYGIVTANNDTTGEITNNILFENNMGDIQSDYSTIIRAEEAIPLTKPAMVQNLRILSQ